MNARWPTKELEHLVDPSRPITYGVVKPGDHDENGITFVRGGDILQGRIAINNLRTITKEVSAKYRRTLLRGGELLISLVGNPGEVAIAPPSLIGANIARQVGLVPLGGQVDPQYVMYFLMSPLGRAGLQAHSKGSVQIVINLADLRTIQVPIPPLLTQHKISSILSAYDDLIENNLRRIKILEEMAKTIYDEWFVKFRFPGHEKVKMVASGLGLIPDGWETKRLGEVIELAYGKGLKEQNRIPGGVPVYGSSGVVGYHNQSLVKGPGIIVGRKGNAGSLHWTDTAYFPIDTVFYVITELPLHYVFLNLRTQNFISGDAAVPGLNRNQTYSLPFILPRAGVLELFSETIEPIFHLLTLAKRKNALLRQTRDLLLPKLISGEIDVEKYDILLDHQHNE